MSYRGATWKPNHSILRPFEEQGDAGIPFNLKNYVELVDWGGREIKQRKCGYIPAHTPPILTRLTMDASPVLDYLSKDDLPSFGALGQVCFCSSVSAQSFWPG